MAQRYLAYYIDNTPYFAGELISMYTNRFILLAATLSILVTSCAPSKKGGKPTNALPGTWQSQPIVIDGDSKDWPSPYPNYDSKAKIGYATSNDRKFLYITMETGDELTQLKILKGGMTVSVDTSGRKDAAFGIKYPLENDNSEIEIPHPAGSSKEAAVHAAKQMAQNIRKAVELNSQYSLTGFKGCDGGYMVSQVTTCNIKLKMRLDEYKEIVWEAAIPIKALYGKDSLDATDAAKPISICVNIAGVKKPKSGSVDNVNNNMGSDMNSTPGSQHNSMQRGGGGRGGGQRSSSESPMEHLYTATKTWKQFTLLVNPQ
jgi:hypothetical protein